MSKKHETLSIGTPNEQAVDPTSGKIMHVRDEYGLSIDPKEHADPKCTSCSGRGVVVKIMNYPKDRKPEDAGLIVSQDGKVRFTDRCGCVEPRYQKRRRIFERAGASFLEKRAAEASKEDLRYAEEVKESR